MPYRVNLFEFGFIGLTFILFRRLGSSAYPAWATAMPFMISGVFPDLITRKARKGEIFDILAISFQNKCNAPRSQLKFIRFFQVARFKNDMTRPQNHSMCP